MFVTGVLGLLCVVAFLFLIDYAARLLRPVSLVKLVGDEGLNVLESVYPDKVTSAPDACDGIVGSPIGRHGPFFTGEGPRSFSQWTFHG